jgi:hypothetical protein
MAGVTLLVYFEVTSAIGGTHAGECVEDVICVDKYVAIGSHFEEITIPKSLVWVLPVRTQNVIDWLTRSGYRIKDFFSLYTVARSPNMVIDVREEWLSSCISSKSGLSHEVKLTYDFATVTTAPQIGAFQISQHHMENLIYAPRFNQITIKILTITWLCLRKYIHKDILKKIICMVQANLYKLLENGIRCGHHNCRC